MIPFFSLWRKPVHVDFPKEIRTVFRNIPLEDRVHSVSTTLFETKDAHDQFSAWAGTWSTARRSAICNDKALYLADKASVKVTVLQYIDSDLFADMCAGVYGGFRQFLNFFATLFSSQKVQIQEACDRFESGITTAEEFLLELDRNEISLVDEEEFQEAKPYLEDLPLELLEELQTFAPFIQNLVVAKGGTYVTPVSNATAITEKTPIDDRDDGRGVFFTPPSTSNPTSTTTYITKPTNPVNFLQAIALKEQHLEQHREELRHALSYWSGMLANTKQQMSMLPETIDNDTSVLELAFLINELSEIEEILSIIKEEIMQIATFQKELTETKDKLQSSSSVLPTFEDLEKMLETLAKNHKAEKTALQNKVKGISPNLLSQMDEKYFKLRLGKHFDKFLAPEVTKLKSTAVVGATGIRNQGNSCYLNATVQALFSSESFLKVLQEKLENPIFAPEETTELQKQRDQNKLTILSTFSQLKHLMDQGGLSSEEKARKNGELVGKLRHAIFNNQAIFKDFVGNITQMQDPSCVITPLFEILDLGHILTTQISGTGPNNVSYHKPEKELQPSMVWSIPAGNTGQRVQTMLDTYCTRGITQDADGWTPEVNGEKLMGITEKTEVFGIAGNAPKVLVIQPTETKYTLDGDISSAEYSLEQSDATLDLAKALGSDQPVLYRLRSTAMHPPGHWTALKMDKEGKWHLCDDSRITPMKGFPIGETVSYMVYEKAE